MCLNHDLYFFWVSSLAYPNLLGKKGYVVVVVVVVVVKEQNTLHAKCLVTNKVFLKCQMLSRKKMSGSLSIIKFQYNYSMHVKWVWHCRKIQM